MKKVIAVMLTVFLGFNSVVYAKVKRGITDEMRGIPFTKNLTRSVMKRSKIAKKR